MSKPIIRCSQLPQLLSCPGSRTLTAIVKAGESGDAAHEGNWGHRYVAEKLISEENAIGPDGGLPEIKLPESYKPSPFARWMADFCYQRVTEDIPIDWAYMVEMDFSYEFPKFILTGHPDVLAVNFEQVKGEQQIVEIIGWDFKFGAIPVDPAGENEQVMGYVVQLTACFPNLRKITFRIVQPRNSESDGLERVTEVVVEGRENLLRAAKFLETSVNNALAHPLSLNSDGGKQCRWCPASLQCPAIHGDMVKFMKLELTEQLLAGIYAEPAIETLINLHDARKKLTPVFDAGSDALKDLLSKSGEQVLGDGRKAWLKPRKGIRSITDMAKADEVLQELPDNLYYQCIELKPTRIEEAFAAKYDVPLDGKKAVTGKNLYQEKLGHLTVQSESQILMVQ